MLGWCVQNVIKLVVTIVITPLITIVVTLLVHCCCYIDGHRYVYFSMTL